MGTGKITRKCRRWSCLFLDLFVVLAVGGLLMTVKSRLRLTRMSIVVFFVFIRFGSTMLFKKWVLTPVNLPKAELNIYKYTQAGFPGCVGSSDCTHIVTNRCQYNLKNNHIGAKSSQTTRTFNLTCNHRRRILHTTKGGPGRWNDQSMVRLDNVVSGIRDGNILNNVTFELFCTR